MNPDTIAVIVLGAVCLAQVGKEVYLGLKLAPRARLVPPQKPETPPVAEPAGQTAPLTEVATEKAA